MIPTVYPDENELAAWGVIGVAERSSRGTDFYHVARQYDRDVYNETMDELEEATYDERGVSIHIECTGPRLFAYVCDGYRFIGTRSTFEWLTPPEDPRNGEVALAKFRELVAIGVEDDPQKRPFAVYDEAAVWGIADTEDEAWSDAETNYGSYVGGKELCLGCLKKRLKIAPCTMRLFYEVECQGGEVSFILDRDGILDTKSKEEG